MTVNRKLNFLLVQAGAYRHTDTGLTSVNSVTVNTIPARNETRLLIGSRVDVQATNSIMINDSTLMPDINGITELMYLLFAPLVKVDMSKDEDDDDSSVHSMHSRPKIGPISGSEHRYVFM